ncbi:MAG: enoyl-CoA hydratase/isomerase family protein [Lysinibacillus sp.]
MNYEYLEVYKDGALGIIKVNRPEVHNALNKQAIQEIGHALAKWEQHDGVYIIVFKGAGEKSFIAGADINQLHQKTLIQGLEADLSILCRRIEACSKITIAAVNGYAFGGGFELALSCDLRIASENAKFGLPELNLGIIPGGGGTQRLVRLIGKGLALDYILTGDTIPAGRALELGIVSEVTSQEELWETVLSKSRKILTKGPLAVRLAKLVVNEGSDMNLSSALTLEKLAQTLLFTTEDKKEGTEAFIEKRTPVYKGH